MENQNISSQYPPSPTRIPAGVWGRFWALAIDSLYILILSYVLYLAILESPAQGFDQIEYDIKFGITFLILYLVYTTYFTVNRGATFGKEAYGFKVITYNSDSNINYPQALLRELIKTGIVFIPIIGSLFYLLNGLVVVCSKEKRGLHDLVAKTQVIKVKQPWSLGRQIILILLPIIIIIGLLAYTTFQKINPARQLKQNQQTRQDSTPLNRNSDNTQTSNTIDTANWKTYTNNRYKISFIYPSDWVSGHISDQVEVNGPANFQIIDSPSHSSLNVNMSKRVTEGMIKDYYSKPTTKQFLISGGQAYENIENNVVQIAIRHPLLEDTLIIVSFVGNNQILNAILDSIKFQ